MNRIIWLYNFHDYTWTNIIISIMNLHVNFTNEFFTNEFFIIIILFILTIKLISFYVI